MPKSETQIRHSRALTPQQQPLTRSEVKDPAILAKIKPWIDANSYRIDGHVAFTLLQEPLKIPNDVLLGSYEPKMCFVKEPYREALKGLPPNPFFPPNVRLVGDRREREGIIHNPEPAVILASSGMLSQGVLPLYARHVLKEPASGDCKVVLGFVLLESAGT